jgi:hypothetical protein
MHLLFFYLAIIIAGYVTGTLQRQALTHQRYPLLIIALYVRLGVILAVGLAVALLHLSLLHLILSIILFWVGNFIAL